MSRAKAWMPPREFPEVDLFLQQFKGRPRFRRAMLAIVGGTGLGKSMLAEAVMSRLASLLGMPSWLEVTVEEDGALDMSDFQFQTQAGSFSMASVTP